MPPRVVLDTLDLTIHRITDAQDRPLRFALGAPVPCLGRPLVVTLPDDVRDIVVHYETGAGASALQWLTAEQTAGRQHPFLYSQGQAILTRSWLPTQDSPGIRQTYTARLVVPHGHEGDHECRVADAGRHRDPDGRAFSFV